MIPITYSEATYWTRVPRACGDDPNKKDIYRKGNECSPRMRG